MPSAISPVAPSVEVYAAMRPGGHLATAVVLSGTGYGVTGSAELAAGCFAGAFMIDVDHYLDYLTVEGQWRRPGPAQFFALLLRSSLPSARSPSPFHRTDGRAGDTRRGLATPGPRRLPHGRPPPSAA